MTLRFSTWAIIGIVVVLSLVIYGGMVGNWPKTTYKSHGRNSH